MFVNSVSVLQPIAAELSLSEKGIASAKVILTGFVVVFSVLLLLIGIIKLYSLIVGKAQSVGSKRSVKPSEESVKLPSVVRETVADEEQTSGEGIPEEVVAVIAAAVASLYGSQGKARIKSIRRAGGRSAWANAGVLDNTRPF